MTASERIKDLSLKLLGGLGACPAVSFAEGAVAAAVLRSLEGLSLSVEQDPYGNLIAHHSGHPDSNGEAPPSPSSPTWTTRASRQWRPRETCWWPGPWEGYPKSASQPQCR